MQQPSSHRPTSRFTFYVSRFTSHVSRPLFLVAVALVIVAIGVGQQVTERLIAPASPLNFDEAAHSLPGYYILRDVRRLDLQAFWGDTHIQTLWPPGFSYLQAPVLAVLGLSDGAARLFSYMTLVLTVLLGLALVRSIKPAWAPVAGLTSGLIALSAPGWLSLGGLALQETPVAMVTFATFWLFLRAWRTGRARWYFLTGCALFFLFLTKYNYAAFALASIGLVDMVERIRMAARRGESPARPGFVRRFFTRRQLATWLALYLPLALGLAFWFLGGTDVVPMKVKWRDFAFFVSNEDSGYPMWSEQNLLFYVRTTINWLMPHPLLALAALLGAGYAVVRIRHPGVTLLALFFTIGFTLATLHQLKAERYAAPFFPSLWLLTGLGLAELKARWEAARTRRAPIPPVAGAVIGQPRGFAHAFYPSLPTLVVVVVLFCGALWSWLTWLPRLEPVWAGDTADALRAAGQQVSDWQDPNRPVLIIGTFGELSPPFFEWRLRTQAAFGNGNIQYDAPPGDGADLERVQHWLQANPGTQVTLIRVDESAAVYNTADMKNKNANRQALVRQFDQAIHAGAVKGYHLENTVDFPRGGITISYYLPQ